MNNVQELKDRLEKLAYKKTTAFCYHCYVPAPSGRCDRCGSDDLMRSLAGQGVEYGVDWVIRSLLRDNLTLVNADEAFEEMIRECYAETTKLGWIEVDTATALKQLDPISWQLAQSEFMDSEESDERVVSFDNGASYYWTSDVESYLDENESEADCA